MQKLKRNGAAMLLAMISLAVITRPVSAYPDYSHLEPSIQAATANSGSTVEFTKDHEHYGTLDGNGTMWRARNLNEDDKCGLIYVLGEQHSTAGNTLEHDGRQRLFFRTLSKEDRAKVEVTFIFRPHKQQRNTFVSVTKPLNQFSFSNGGENTIEAEMPTSEIWQNQNGDPDLMQVNVILNGKAEATLRGFEIRLRHHMTPRKPDINLTTGDRRMLE